MTDTPDIRALVGEIEADRAKGTADLGGWGWFGGRDHVYLATRRGGRHFIMDFVRKGMNGAQPRFQINGLMHGAIDALTTYAVGDASVRGQKQAAENATVYRLDVSGIDHPDARRIARTPDLESALLASDALIKALVEAGEATLDAFRDMGFEDCSESDALEALSAVLKLAEEHGYGK